MAFSKIRRRLRIARMENAMSPRQIHQMIEKRPRLGLLFMSSQRLQKMRPADFEREVICPELLIFRRPPAPGRMLLVCFTDVNFGLLSPTPLFLQALGDLAADVMVVSDHRQLYHECGLRGRTGSLLETCALIRDIAAADGYSQTVTYGCSIGGLPALRAGILLKARRAISISGRFSPAQYWQAGGRLPARAFDPLCASGAAAAAATQLVALYPPGNFHDADSARQLGARLPDIYRLPCSGGYHNIFHTMMGTRGESDMLQDLFNPDFDLDGFCIEEYRKRTDPMEWQ